ncbi:MAG: M81 family metallopeptidase [Candidatus Pelethousia sp.]|nr:M81 family metallopeptidase [Candidatus Pelethousia sp.]
MKILIGKFGHEANTFSAHTASYALFTASGTLTCDDKIPPMFKGTPDYIGGMLAAAEEYGAKVIPTIACLAAAPTLSQDCANRLLGQLMSYVVRYKDEIDGICLGLHGAGCAEYTDDLEGYVLKAVRDVVGYDMPVMVTLDLHANVSPDMLRLSSGLFGIKQYPHVDMFDAGYLAMKTLIHAINGKNLPNIAMAELPMVIPHSAGYTFDEPLSSINSYFQEYAAAHRLIDATLFHGFPPADTPFTRSSVVVVARSGAQEAADELAAYIWSKREQFVPESLTPAEAMDRAASVSKEGYIVINELSDNPGGGAPGDGTHLLREMLRRNYPKTIMGYIYDPIAVQEIMERRVGEHISLSLGGKTEPVHGEPIEIKDAEIICLGNGEVVYVSPVHANLPDTIGACARIRTGNVDIIIGSVLHQTYDDRPFLATGADIAQYRYVGLKSAHHFRAFFQDRAAAIITADPPGLMSGDLKRYDFHKMPRPIFPLDKDAAFFGK